MNFLKLVLKNRIKNFLKEYKEISKTSKQEFRKFVLKFHGLSTFNNRVVYVDLNNNEGKTCLENLQSIIYLK